jgi:DNA ligase (NAD+)
MPTLDEVVAQASQARIKELEGLITKAREAYYNPTGGLPLYDIPDEVYDAWTDELSELKADSPAVTAIGAPPPATSEWKKAAHGISMGSLDKVNTLEEMTAWIMGVCGDKMEPLLVTEKLDGISIHVKYEKGGFSQAITRGDGSIGEDISNNVVRMKGIPARLVDRKFSGSLRGEIVLLKGDHLKHFADYANTRNAAGGISKRFDGKGCEHLSIMFYQVVEGKDFESEGEQFEWLREQGLRIPNWYVTAMAPGIRTPHDLWVEYQQTKRAELDYDIDGLVVRLNNIAKQISLGEKDGRPTGAVAFKFAAITRETTIRRIDWQVGGTGRITPVAVFAPVQVMGAEVTNASLYNLKYIQDLGVGVGAHVLIARANDVIPRVVSVRRPPSVVEEAPAHCPTCGSGTMMDGEYLICPNTADCSAQTVGRIKRYVKELDIKEWGETLIEKLVEGGLVKRVSDLYKLSEDQLAGVERMGKKSAQNVLKTLWDRNPISLENLLGACSIPLCASTTVKMAMDAGFDTLDKLKVADAGSLGRVSGLGPVKAQAMWKWFHDHGDIIDDLLAAGVKIKEKIRGSLSGLSFCFTGASSRPRGELEDLVRAAGGEVKASVTKKLTYLVMADANSTTTKAQAARKNGTKVLGEADFLRMVGEE